MMFILMSPVDAVLELQSMKRSDSTIMGLITVQLSTSDPARAGVIAILNAQQDIERGNITGFAGITDSKPARVVGAAVNVVANPRDVVTLLESVVSKLDVFVQIVNQAAKVNLCTWC